MIRDADLKGAGDAEVTMRFATLAKNTFAFRTGLENYCQCLWGVPGYQKARKARTFSIYDTEALMTLFTTNNDQFFKELHDLMENP